MFHQGQKARASPDIWILALPESNEHVAGHQLTAGIAHQDLHWCRRRHADLDRFGGQVIDRQRQPHGAALGKWQTYDLALGTRLL